MTAGWEFVLLLAALAMLVIYGVAFVIAYNMGSPWRTLRRDVIYGGADPYRVLGRTARPNLRVVS